MNQEASVNFEIFSWKMSPESILDHFKKRFNPTNLINSVTPDELSGNLPEFARELQIISNKFLINHEVPTISEIQKHLCQSKPEKASNDVDVELLKKVNTHLCFKLFIECQLRMIKPRSSCRLG